MFKSSNGTALKYGIIACGGILVSSAVVYHAFNYTNERNKRKAKKKKSDDKKNNNTKEVIPKIVVDDVNIIENDNVFYDSQLVYIEPIDQYSPPQNQNEHSPLQHEIKNIEIGEEDHVGKMPCEDECDDFDEQQKPSRKILLLGLENSGKSSLLSQLSKEGTDCLDYEPTKGFNVVCISFESIDLSIWEIGGGENYRTYWKNFSATTDLILFVVDSSQPEKFLSAKKYFFDIINDLNDSIDFRLIATKSDLPGSVSIQEIRKGLGLDGMEWEIVKVAVTTGGATQNVGIEEVQSFCLNV